MVSLVVDEHQGEEVEVKTGVPQGSLVLPILFPVYLSGILKKVKKIVEGCMSTSFADNYGWLVVADLVKQLFERLEKAGAKVVGLRERNHVAFENVKDKAIAFMRRRKPELKKRIEKLRITVR